MKTKHKNKIEYTFRLLQCHYDIPALVGWYWIVDTPEMLEIFLEKNTNNFTWDPVNGPIIEVITRYRKESENRKAGKLIHMQIDHYTDKRSFLLDFHVQRAIEEERIEKNNISKIMYYSV